MDVLKISTANFYTETYKDNISKSKYWYIPKKKKKLSEAHAPFLFFLVDIWKKSNGKVNRVENVLNCCIFLYITIFNI